MTHDDRGTAHVLENVMTRPPPALANWLLEMISPTDALIGDVRELYDEHRSKRRFWWEVLVIAAQRVRDGAVRRPVVALRRVVVACAVAAASVAIAKSEPDVRVTDALRVKVHSTGWLESSLPGDQTRLTPAIIVSVSNTSDARLPAVRVNAVFRLRGHRFEWGNTFPRVAQSPALHPRAVLGSQLVTGRGTYESILSPSGMFGHPRFVDATVAVFGRYGSKTWTKLGEYPVARTVLASYSPRRVVVAAYP
jgi:hypothetical protein